MSFRVVTREELLGMLSGRGPASAPSPPPPTTEQRLATLEAQVQAFSRDLSRFNQALESMAELTKNLSIMHVLSLALAAERKEKKKKEEEKSEDAPKMEEESVETSSSESDDDSDE